MSGIITIAKGGSLELEPRDGGFAYGESLFETIKLMDGGLCFWKGHWARLTASAHALGFDLPDEASVLVALREWMAVEECTAGILKLSLMRRGESSTLYIYGREELGALPGAVRLRVETNTRLNSASLLAGHKSHNYMEAMLLWRAAQAAGFYDCLRLTTSGHLAEAGVSNVFFLKAGVLHTPALETGILPGVVRAEVLRLAPEVNLKTREGTYEMDALEDAEAVFLTNSVAGMVPVALIPDIFEGDSAEQAELVALRARLASAEKLASVIP